MTTKNDLMNAVDGQNTIIESLMHDLYTAGLYGQSRKARLTELNHAVNHRKALEAKLDILESTP